MPATGRLRKAWETRTGRRPSPPDISVTIPESLLDDLDAYVARRGTATNRSEAVRDLVRGALVRERPDNPEGMVFGVVCMVFEHTSTTCATS